MHPKNAALVLDPTWTVNDIVRRYPATVAILNSLGVDTCCGGGLPLPTVAQKHRLNLEALRSTLETAIRGATAA